MNKNKTNLVTKQNKEIEICCHIISYYYYDDDLEMPDSDIEHIKELICDGMNQGELNTLNSKNLETGGWWHIIK